jgi:hypothetical protein
MDQHQQRSPSTRPERDAPAVQHQLVLVDRDRPARAHPARCVSAHSHNCR